MVFVHIKPKIDKEKIHEYIIQWQGLLMTNGFELKPYLVEDDLVLIHTDAISRVSELKAFILNPEFSDGIVDYWETNQIRTYPDGHPEQILQAQREALKVGELLEFAAVARSVASGDKTAHAAHTALKELLAAMVNNFENYKAEPRASGQFHTKEEDRDMAEYYVFFISKMVEAGDQLSQDETEGRVQKEIKRLEAKREKTEGAGSHDKKKLLEQKANIARSFIRLKKLPKKKKTKTAAKQVEQMTEKELAQLKYQEAESKKNAELEKLRKRETKLKTELAEVQESIAGLERERETAVAARESKKEL